MWGGGTIGLCVCMHVCVGDVADEEENGTPFDYMLPILYTIISSRDIIIYTHSSASICSGGCLCCPLCPTPLPSRGCVIGFDTHAPNMC